jgi:hypothetical protein
MEDHWFIFEVREAPGGRRAARESTILHEQRSILS